jgi:putative ABC transport system permease protein
MVNAVLLRPLPYAAPDRLVQLYESMPPEVPRNVVSRGTYLDWRDGTRSFTEVAAYMVDFGYGITGDGEPLQATGAQASPGLFRVLGASAQIGRTFTDAEGERGNDRVVLLSHDFWRDRFGGRRDVVGRTLTIDGSPMAVVGVMPPGFDFPSRRTDLWVPAAFRESDRESRQAHMLHVVGRLAAGATLESAREELRSMNERQRERYPDAYDGWGANVFPLRADIVRNVRSALWVLLGAVGLVLLIASVNVANLLLARSIAREREVSVRAALGAGRWRLVRQFLAEGAVLAAIGGSLGVALAAVAVRLLVALDPGDIPLLIDTRLDARVLVFALAATLSTVFLFALAPALRIARADLHAGLRAGRGPSDGLTRHRGLRNGLLVTELALSVVLVVGAGLLLRSFVAVRAVDAGFDMDDVLAISLNLPVPAYGAPESHMEFYQQLIDRVTALPGVESAGGTSEPPIVGFEMTRSIAVDGYTFADGERSDLPYHAVTRGYFDMLRIPLVAGRGFTDADRAGAAPVVVVNEATVRRFWPDGDAVGRRVRLSEDGPWYEVVGVVGDTRHYGLDADPQPSIYAPYAQKDWDWLTWMTVMVRTQGDALALARPVQREVWAIDPNLPIQTITTLDAIYAESIGRRRFNTMLLGAFAALALVLGAVGVYGVVSYTVAQRSREIGIRMALGARAGAVVAGIVRDGLRLAFAATGLGLAGAFAASGLLGGLLFGVAATDAVTFVAAPLLITGVALIATWLPARRAASVEPLRVLREG